MVEGLGVGDGHLGGDGSIWIERGPPVLRRGRMRREA